MYIIDHNTRDVQLGFKKSSVLAKIVPKCRESHSLKKSCGCQLVSDFSSEMYFSPSPFQEPLSWEGTCSQSYARHAGERAGGTMRTSVPTQSLLFLR